MKTRQISIFFVVAKNDDTRAGGTNRSMVRCGDEVLAIIRRSNLEWNKGYAVQKLPDFLCHI